MNPTRSALTLLAAMLVVFVLAVGSAGAADVGVVRVGGSKNGASVTLQRGSRLVVSLKGNATTGYAWKVRSVDKSVLKPLGVTYVQNPNPKHLLGVGGVYRLPFKALARGTTVLKLVYVRGKEFGGSYTLRVVVS
jgi:predicted secreted protein